MKISKLLTLGILLMLPLMLLSTMAIDAEGVTEKPIIVCTTSAVGNIVKQFLGDTADVVVLIQPGLCPADFDMTCQRIPAPNFQY